MAQVMAGDLRKGVTFLYDGNKIMTVVDFLHVKPGKGAAFVRMKMKNVVTGAVLEQTFNPTEKFELAHIDTRQMEYLYTDGEFYYFMDTETYEQIPLNQDQVEDALNFVKENMQVTIKSFQGTPFSVEPPNFVELLITVCEPAVAGNTATNATKPATVETGYELQVPMFVNEGDTIRIDTRTGEYMSRV
ncbi:MAG: elongation factor P [Clostridia bacterium]|nr:elongation factor P [Clostridia bacterium]